MIVLRSELDPRLLPHLGELPRDLFPPSFTTGVELIERYGEQWAVELARSLGLTPSQEMPGETASEVVRRLGFLPTFTMAMEWLLNSLVSAGHAAMSESEHGVRYRLLGPLPPSEKESLRAELLEVSASHRPAVDLLDAACSAYPAVARGERKGEEVLLAPAGMALWSAYFNNQNPLYAINNRVAAIAVANRLPVDRPARVLEVGAGAGSGTEALLEELARRNQLGSLGALVVSEPSPFFRRRAQRSLPARFPEAPLSFAELDIDQQWPDQGLEPASFDLIYGVNVFHVAKDLGRSLAAAREALRPGGALVLGECLRPPAGHAIAAEAVFSLLESFYSVNLQPPQRPNAGFLSPQAWRLSFEKAGFVAFETVPEIGPIHALTPRFLTGAICGRPNA